MVNPNVRRADAVSDLLSGAVQTSLVNCGQDTKLLLRDGSTILLKGISRLDGVLLPTGSEAAPIGSEISGDGKDSHHWRNGGEGLGRVGE